MKPARSPRTSARPLALCGALLALLVLLHPQQAGAISLFDGMVDNFGRQSNTWMRVLTDFMTPALKVLAVIELAAAAAIWMFEKDNLNSLALEVIKKVMVVGLFSFLLQNAPEITAQISNMFVSAGSKAGAFTTPLTTDGILTSGLDAIGKLWTQTGLVLFPLIMVDPEEILGNANPVAYAGLVFAILVGAMTILATLLIAYSYVVVAAEFFCLTIESYVMFAVGIVILGLGSTTWTKDYAMKYLNYAINVGVRYLTLILILSITRTQINDMVSNSHLALNLFKFDFTDLLNLVAAALLQGILAKQAPEMANALLNGGTGLSASSAKGAAASVASGAMAPVRVATSAVQGAKNFGKAASAGREVAQQQGKTGSAATMSGIGKALKESAKAVPGLMKNSSKHSGSSNSSHGHGHGSGSQHSHQPGIFDQAKQALRKQAGHDPEGQDGKTGKDARSHSGGGAPGTDTGQATQSMSISINLGKDSQADSPPDTNSGGGPQNRLAATGRDDNAAGPANAAGAPPALRKANAPTPPNSSADE